METTAMALAMSAGFVILALARQWQRASLAFVALALWAVIITADALVSSAQAQGARLIPAAVVNDVVITRLDVEERLNALAWLSQIQSEQGRNALLPQVLQSMINETIKWQVATQQNNVRVEPAVVQQNIQQLAQRYNLSADELASQLVRMGSSIRTIRRQVEADIAWLIHVNAVAENELIVNDEQTSIALDQQTKQLSSSPKQWRLQRIFLPTDLSTPRSEHLIRIQRIKELLTQGAAFEELARGVSEDIFAPRGGEMGWFQTDTLSATLLEALQDSPEGGISSIIEEAKGLAIYRLAAVRQTQQQAMPTSDNVRAQLRSSMVESLSARLLLAERLRSFIDIRI